VNAALTAEEKKLLEAMHKDEATVQKELASLTSLSTALIQIRVKLGKSETVVMARRLRRTEISAYLKRQGLINPALKTAKRPQDANLTPEENDKLYALIDETITLATGLPKEKLAEIDNDKIRAALLVGILRASEPSETEIEEMCKFREDA
jgi:hypothetical protein